MPRSLPGDHGGPGCDAIRTWWFTMGPGSSHPGPFRARWSGGLLIGEELVDQRPDDRTDGDGVLLGVAPEPLQLVLGEQDLEPLERPVLRGRAARAELVGDGRHGVVSS